MVQETNVIGTRICWIEEGQDQDVTAVELEGVFWTGWNMGSLWLASCRMAGTNLLFTTFVEATMAPPPASPADFLLACWPPALALRQGERTRPHDSHRLSSPDCAQMLHGLDDTH